jgi:hypothetical protein
MIITDIITKRPVRFLLPALILFSFAQQLTGQEENVDIRATLRFSSDVSSTIYILSFGVGSDYTDTTDREFEEFIPPFAPPGGYLIAFERECQESDGDPPCYFKQDFRGIPDSVKERGLKQFTLTYRLRIRNLTNEGLNLAIRNPDWPVGLDSVRIVDIQLASAFDETFTGPRIDTVSDPQTVWLDVTAYYNLAVSSVTEKLRPSEELLHQLVNPVVGHSLSLSPEIRQRGGRLVLVTHDGRSVVEHSLQQGDAGILPLEGLPNGPYHLIHFDRRGVLREGRSIVLLR